MESEKLLQIEASRAVSGSVACTSRAIILRLVAGNLADGRPQLIQPGAEATAPSSLPCIVITAEGGRYGGITKFGRLSSRRTLVPDLTMHEHIASRSHFNIVYDQPSNRYQIMDAGSKWGTFEKLNGTVPISCGDWIRVGNCEFVIRHCGGNCKSHRPHSHYRQHALRLLREHKGGGACGGCGKWSSNSDPAPPPSRHTAEEETSFQDGLFSVLSGVRHIGWTKEHARLGRQGVAGGLGPSSSSSSAQSEIADLVGEGDCPAAGTTALPDDASAKVALHLPLTSLDLDFVSGPRMGEHVTLSDRICTMGRGEGCTIQLSDPMLANVSRIHCVLEQIGGRWHIRDNGSTNGTWRRLSCMLEPSRPVPLVSGTSILAGLHEFIAEEADLGYTPVPSAATLLLKELSATSRRDNSSTSSVGRLAAAGVCNEDADDNQ